MTPNDPSVLEFRLQRLLRAPRNWTYWVAGFTAVNGLFLALKQHFMILAGLVAPFAIPGVIPHVVAAAAFALMAYFSDKLRPILFAALVLYIADAIFAAVAGLWAGVVMHIVVLAFIGMAYAGVRAIRRLQANQPGREA